VAERRRREGRPFFNTTTQKEKEEIRRSLLTITTYARYDRFIPSFFCFLLSFFIILSLVVTFHLLFSGF